PEKFAFGAAVSRPSARASMCLIETLGRSLGRDTRVSFAIYPLVSRASAARPGTQGPRDESHDAGRAARANLEKSNPAARTCRPHCGRLGLPHLVRPGSSIA